MKETIVETTSQRLRYWLDDNDHLQYTVLLGQFPVTEGRTAAARLKGNYTCIAIERLLQKPEIERVIVENYEIKRTN